MNCSSALRVLRGRIRTVARDARDDGGAVLVLALLVITTIALVATAVLVRGNGACVPAWCCVTSQRRPTRRTRPATSW